MVSFSSTHGPSRQTATERYTELRAAFLDRSDYDPAENCSAEKGGRLYSEISALIYESNIDEKNQCQERTKNILWNFRVDFRDQAQILY